MLVATLAQLKRHYKMPVIAVVRERKVFMIQPTIFFSHSSADKKVLSKLKELFCEKTGGTIEVFLSSDGQSIPLGKNWVHRVQEALDEAKIMIVFLTPSSLRSSWIYFEAGYAYSKNIRVVPVGFLGADISSVAPPISLLQGFNIESKDSLDNLIALVNDVFSYNHKGAFTEEEYRSLVLEGGSFDTHPLGELVQLVNEIHIEITERDNLNCTAQEGISLAKGVFQRNNLEHRDNENYVEAFGLTVHTTEGQSPKPIKFEIDPALIETTIPLAIEVIREIRKDGIKGISIRFDFNDTVDCENKNHKLTARLFETGVSLGKEEGFVYEGMNFTMSHLMNFHGRSIKQGAAYLSVTPIEDLFELHKVSDLMDLLFSKKVLFESEQWVEV